jgi:SAM-dependent methyltransferase
MSWIQDRARGATRMVRDGEMPRVADVRAQISGHVAGTLVERRVEAQPALRPLYEAMTDEQARMHYGEEDIVADEHLRNVTRLFHAWKVTTLRERIGDRLAEAKILDVGDSDGRVLRDLGKPGTGFNVSDSAIANIRANGIEAVQGDGHTLPFEDASFDYVQCFQTLEHAESPHAMLGELARVCRPGGRVFVSIPWVPHTIVHARVPGVPRGEEHVFELSDRDFAALVTHTPLRLEWSTTCEVFGAPATLAERAFLALNRRRHVVAATFRRFAFYELAPS